MFSYWNPPPSNHYVMSMQTHLTKEMYELVKEYSKKHNISMSEYLRRALAREIARDLSIKEFNVVLKRIKEDNNEIQKQYHDDTEC